MDDSLQRRLLMARRSPLIPALIACALLLSLNVSLTIARVSWHWGAASQSNRALTSVGGTAAYSAEININGADADLSVFSFEGAADSVVPICDEGTLESLAG